VLEASPSGEVSVSEYVDVEERARELGCSIPTGIALLPRNLASARSKDELIHENTVSDMRKVLREAGIAETTLEAPGERFPFALERHFDWAAPIIFVAPLVLTENPQLVTVVLKAIADHVRQWLRGVPRSLRSVKLSVVVQEKPGRYKMIEYEGPADGINDLADLVRSAQWRTK